MPRIDQHLVDVDESYLEHMTHAGSFGLQMVVAGCACLIHAVLPFACITTGSKAISRLNDRMVVNRLKSNAPAASQVADGAD